jgi:CHAT domain-containing protein
MNQTRSAALALLATGLLGLGAISAINPPAMAQTVLPIAPATTEADRLLQQGIKQFDASQFDAALQSAQQALAAYRASQNRQGEGQALRQMGRAYYQLKDEAKAIAYFEQSLAIAREVKNRKEEGRSLGNLGIVHHALKNFDKAIEYHQQSVAIAHAIADQKGEGLSLENLALTYTTRKEFAKSVEYSQQALAIWRQMNDRDGELTVLQDIVKAYQALDNSGKAIEYLTQRLQVARALQNRKVENFVLVDLGIAYYEIKNYSKSIEFHQQSLLINTDLNDQAGMANSLSNIGLAYKAQNILPEALQAFEKSLAIRQKQPKKAETIDLFLTVALLSQKLKKYPQAIGYYEQYLSGARDRPNFKEEALILKVVGDLYRSQPKSKENAEKAVKYYTDSLKIAEKQGNQSDVNHALHGLAIVHMRENRFKLAIEHFNKALSGWRALKDQTMEANALMLLGSVYAGAIEENGSSMCAKGLGYLETSLTMLRQLKDQPVEAEVLGTLGNCYEEAKNYPKGIEYKELSLAIARQTKNQRQEGIILSSLGKSHLLAGNLPQAQAYGQQGLTLLREVQDRQGEVSALDNLANIYVASGEPKKAIDAQMQKITIAQKYDIRLLERGFNAISLNLEQAKKFNYKKHNQRSYDWYRQRLTERGFAFSSLNLSESNISDYLFYIRDAFVSLGDAYAKAGDNSQAVTFYQAALEPDFEKGYSYSFNDIELLGKLGRTLAKMERTSEAESMLRLALQYAEVFRTNLGYIAASASYRAWTDNDRIKFAERQAEDYRQLQQVLVRQNQTDKALEIAEESRSRTFVELLSARANDRPLGKDLPNAPKLDAIRRIAKTQNATLVEYAIASPELLYMWVVKPTGEITFRTTKLDAKVSLKQLVRNSRRSIGVRSRGASKAPSTDSNTSELKQLHQSLIAPIAQDLPQDPNDRVIFLPQGPLFLVPFAALQDANGQYLIQQHAIATAPSIQTLELTQAKTNPTQPGKALVVGDPTMPIFEGEQLPALPGARQEAIDIAKILDTQAMIGDQGSKAAVLQQMPTASIIHLATHGLLDTIKGDIPGAVALAPNAPDSGLLTSSEIFDLKLKANLVVLSACDTGRGEITGDGVVGLSRSFIAAGVPSVLVSLWAVNDRSTNVLMSDFYQNLKTNPNKAQSLRQAMLTTMKQYPNPSDWAAFTLIGESK